MPAKKLPIHSVLIMQVRKAAGLTCYAAAKRAGITQRAYTSIEDGADPRLSTLRAVALALGVPLASILGPDPVSEKNPENPDTVVDSSSGVR